MRSLRVRSATQADVPAICTLQSASLVETYEPFLGRTAVEDFMAGGSVERYFDAHWRECTIATVRDEIVGVAVRQGTLLDLVWVKPSLRSKGVGSTLMATIEGQAALDGKELRLEVWAVNERAVGFYQRRGFSVVGVVWDPVTGLEKLLMRKAL